MDDGKRKLSPEEEKRRRLPASTVRDKFWDCLDWVQEGGELIIMRYKAPRVRMSPLETGEVMVVADVPLLNFEEDLSLPPELRAAHGRHPKVARRIMGMLLKMNSAEAKSLLVMLEAFLCKEYGQPAPSAPPATQPDLLVTETKPEPGQEAPQEGGHLHLVPDHEEKLPPPLPSEDLPRFPKMKWRKEREEKLVCQCGRVGAHIVGMRIKIYREDYETELWAGELGEQRTLPCRECGWGVIFTRRREDYWIEYGTRETELASEGYQ